MPTTVDLHLHTTASDGSDSPAQLLRLLQARGVRTFSVTDHDTIDGTVEMLSLVPEEMRFFTGVEFSCRSAAGKYHILGYGFDPEDPLLKAALAEGRQLRRNKMEERIRYLKEAHGIVLTEEEVRWLRSLRSPGKPHLGQLLLNRGLGDPRHGMMAVLRQYVNGFKGSNDRIHALTAIRAIRHAGGVAVWAHPLGGEGKRHKTPEEFAPRLQDLLTLGIQGLECYYSRYTPQEIAFLQDAARQNGLLISGGSDYHGAPKPDLLPGQLCSESLSVTPEMLTLCR